MHTRCKNKKARQWFNYGGRGIKICKRWKKYENFLADVGRRPSPLHSIERIDNEGHYEPSNVRWATRQEQNSNRSTSRRIYFNGQTRCLTEWARVLGISHATLRERLENWPFERAMTERKKEAE